MDIASPTALQMTDVLIPCIIYVNAAGKGHSFYIKLNFWPDPILNMPASPLTEITRILTTFVYAARKDLDNVLTADAIADNSFPSSLYHALDTIGQKGSVLSKIYTFKGGEIPTLINIVMDEMLEAAHALLSQHTLVTADSVADEIAGALPAATIGRVFDYMNQEFGPVLKAVGDSKNWISSKFTEKLSPVASNPVDRAIYETAFVCFMKAVAYHLCSMHHYNHRTLDSKDWCTLMSINGTFTHSELRAQVAQLPVRESKPRKKTEASSTPTEVTTVVVETPAADPVADLIAAI